MYGTAQSGQQKPYRKKHAAFKGLPLTAVFFVKKERNMIQDIAPLHLDNAYCDRKPEKNDRILAFHENMIYMQKEPELTFLTFDMLKTACKEKGITLPEHVYLFSIGEEAYFLMELPEDITFNGFSYYRMFEVRRLHPKERILAAATAWHLYVWYRDNQYCGRCGRKLYHSTKQRMLECRECGNLVFPQIAPAVIVGVTDGSKILMTKYADREYKRYALIAGFTEIGETAEETVKREVEEEVGLHVKNIRYYKSQPWGFDSNLLLGYFCELEQREKIILDTGELSVAEWVDYRDIPDDVEGLSLTHEMMTVFREEQKRKESLDSQRN